MQLFNYQCNTTNKTVQFNNHIIIITITGHYYNDSLMIYLLTYCYYAIGKTYHKYSYLFVLLT